MGNEPALFLSAPGMCAPVSFTARVYTSLISDLELDADLKNRVKGLVNGPLLIQLEEGV